MGTARIIKPNNMSYVDIVARYLQLTLHEIKKDDGNLYVKIISKID